MDSEDLEFDKLLGDKDPLPGNDLISGPSSKPISLESASTVEDLSNKYSKSFQECLELYSEIAPKVLKDIKLDRIQTQDVIDHLFQVVRTNGKVSPVYVESLVNAMRNKSEITLSLVKVMDSITRFISAGKNNEVLSNVNVSFDVSELTRQLAKAPYEDEK